MKIDRKGLKAQAKQAIRAAAPVFWLVTLVYLLLTEGLSTVVGWLAPTFQPADLLWGGTVGGRAGRPPERLLRHRLPSAGAAFGPSGGAGAAGCRVSAH